MIAGFQNGRMLHVVDGRGEITRSLGGPFPIEPPPGVKYPVDTITRLKEYANTGAPALAACSNETGIVVVAQLQGPGIQAYTTAGDLLWSTRLPAYHGHTYWQDPQGRPVTVFGNDATRTLLLLDSRTLLVQVSRRKPYKGRVRPGSPQRIEHVSLTSTVFDLRSGRVLATGQDLPPLSTTRGSTVVESQLDPFPLLRVRPFKLGRR